MVKKARKAKASKTRPVKARSGKARSGKATAKKSGTRKPKKTARLAAGMAGMRPHLAAHPATLALTARVNSCNKPPVKYLKQPDGSYLECFLKSDCTYGDCVPVDEDTVPASLR